MPMIESNEHSIFMQAQLDRGKLEAVFLSLAGSRGRKSNGCDVLSADPNLIFQ